MESHQKISVSLTPAMMAQVETAAQSEDYASVNHVVNDALLLWAESRKAPEEQRDRLRQAIQDGLDSGPAVDGTVEELIDGVKQRGRERLARAQKAA
ncbi:MAG: type II toxin-antitoxin system ParD family antitoxin [Sphingomonadaceae bacterium]